MTVRSKDIYIDQRTREMDQTTGNAEAKRRPTYRRRPRRTAKFGGRRTTRSPARKKKSEKKWFHLDLMTYQAARRS